MLKKEVCITYRVSVRVCMPCVSENPSKFFPPPYKPDIDGPPFSMLDAAREKLSLLTRDLPDQILHEHLSLLTDSPGYAAFFLTYLHRYERLLDAKPVLIQGAFARKSTLVLSILNLCAYVRYQNASRTIHGSYSLL